MICYFFMPVFDLRLVGLLTKPNGGDTAQAKRTLIDPGKHLVLAAPHPSPLSAHKGFFGSKPFSQANAYLQAHGQAPIAWG